jgi:hypothetical protein
LTTTVMRLTNRCPCLAWRVRYTITGGPAAGLGPKGDQTVEVETDAAGRASIEIFQREPGPGTNTVQIQIFRPSHLGAACGAVGPVGAGCTSQTWCAAGVAPVSPGKGLPSEPSGGPVTSPGTGRAGGGPLPFAPGLDVELSGPEQAVVGEEVRMMILLSNRTQTPIGNLTVEDRYDPGLEHPKRSPIKRTLPDPIGPGQTKRIGVDFRVVQPGRLCHTVEVTGNGRSYGSKEGCVVATEKPVAWPPATPRPSGAAKLSLRLTQTPAVSVGQAVNLKINVSNEGTQALTGVKITVDYDPAMEPAQGTEGGGYEGNDYVWALASLQPGQSREYDISYLAVKPSIKADSRVKVTSQEGAQAQDAASTEIRSGAASNVPGLNVAIRSLPDPLVVGRERTFLINVLNNAQTAESQVVLKVIVPPELMVNALVTSGPARSYVEGQTVRFDPVEKVFAGQPLVYRVRVLPKKPGDARLQVQLTSRTLQQPMLVETQIKIVKE